MKPGELNALVQSVKDRNPDCDAATLHAIEAALRKWLANDAERRAKYRVKEADEWALEVGDE